MSRKTQVGKSISWRIAIDLNQQKITRGSVPFLIDWCKCAHPCESLNNAYQLRNFKITHPSGKLIAEKLFQLGLMDSYIKQGEVVSFSLTIAHKGKELTLSG